MFNTILQFTKVFWSQSKPFRALWSTMAAPRYAHGSLKAVRQFDNRSLSMNFIHLHFFSDFCLALRVYLLISIFTLNQFHLFLFNTFCFIIILLGGNMCYWENRQIQLSYHIWIDLEIWFLENFVGFFFYNFREFCKIWFYEQNLYKNIIILILKYLLDFNRFICFSSKHLILSL